MFSDYRSTVAIRRLPCWAFRPTLAFTRSFFHETKAKYGLTRTNGVERHLSGPDRKTGRNSEKAPPFNSAAFVLFGLRRFPFLFISCQLNVHPFTIFGKKNAKFTFPHAGRAVPARSRLRDTLGSGINGLRKSMTPQASISQKRPRFRRKNVSMADSQKEQLNPKPSRCTMLDKSFGYIEILYITKG